jgi:hypothetical protein
MGDAEPELSGRMCRQFSQEDGYMGDLIFELWGFMKERKKFWLLPIIITLLLLGALLALTGGSAVAPFVYTLF